MEFRTVNRNILNMLHKIEFKHECELNGKVDPTKSRNFGYEEFIKHVENECAQNLEIKTKCTLCDEDKEFSKEDLSSHVSVEC